MKINEIIPLINKYLNNFLYHTIKSFSNNITDFINFLINKNIIQSAIGIMIATQIGKISDIIVTNIILPIINAINILSNDKFEDFKYNILGIEFNFGKVILGIIQFLIILFCIYMLWKALTSLDSKYILDTINNFTPNENK
jgi:large conductance mechanosensitive channel